MEGASEGEQSEGAELGRRVPGEQNPAGFLMLTVWVRH